MLEKGFFKSCMFVNKIVFKQKIYVNEIYMKRKKVWNVKRHIFIHLLCVQLWLQTRPVSAGPSLLQTFPQDGVIGPLVR